MWRLSYGDVGAIEEEKVRIQEQQQSPIKRPHIAGNATRSNLGTEVLSTHIGTGRSEPSKRVHCVAINYRVTVGG